MQLIDFSKAKEITPEYTGSEKKKTMVLNNKKYLVKFLIPIDRQNWLFLILIMFFQNI